jgi:hypothetical protein
MFAILLNILAIFKDVLANSILSYPTNDLRKKQKNDRGRLVGDYMNPSYLQLISFP